MWKQSAILSAIALCAGCGAGYDPAQQQPAPGTGAAAQPGQNVRFIPVTKAPSHGSDNVPLDIPNFPIDAGVGVDLPPATFAITTNGTDWIIAWTGDFAQHEFYGDILTGGDFTNVVADGLFEGDTAQLVSTQDLFIDGITDGNNIQSVSVTSSMPTVRFNLFIDGIPAAYQLVFSSGGLESTTDTIPFDLTPSGGVVGHPIATPPAYKKKSSAPGAQTAGAAVTPARHVNAPAVR